MRKLVYSAVTASAVVLLLAGCASADPAAQTLEVCKTEIINNLDASTYDWADLGALDLPTALKDSGIPDPEGSAEGMYTAWGEIEADGERYSVVCTADIVDGEPVIVPNHPLVTAK